MAKSQSSLETENQRLKELISWVGQKIQALNVNGRRSEKFCLICKKTIVRGPQCRHREIWEIMAEEFRKVPDPQQLTTHVTTEA